MCQELWDALRAKISERGLDHLIASSEEIAAEQLRDQVELEAVGRTLVDTAGRAVQPATIGVWLRERTS